MEKNQITHNNHYVPRFYLKNWSSDGKRIWGYRLLVSSENIVPWKQYLIDNIAYQQDLYTLVDNGQEEDDFERFLEKEIEVPAQESIKKIVGNKELSSTDWERIVYFVAAQDLRTPLNYIEARKRWIETLEPVLQNSLENGVQKYIQHRDDTFKTAKTRSKYGIFDDLVKYEIIKEKDQSYISAELPIGRKLWIAHQKYHLQNNVDALLSHKWSIISPAGGLTWPTSDHPVVKLEYTSDKKYNLKGGWGKNKTDIFMPISPNHLLFTEVGEELPDYYPFSFELTFRFIKFIAEKAFRFIFSEYRNHWLPIIRPRYVDPDEFKNEENQWKIWHEDQSESERKFT